ncbi:hypothetical protein Dsin_029788 [Dipteronia sinensis]|uniref:DNA-directed RNA polymerase subunit n=2 Tax=Dipteronia sinensis TaxID=43782 RepID=A0AAE0DX17_9ROSI|nr:hypothetical protein Dsin_029788 [Dipteronia sinensis]
MMLGRIQVMCCIHVSGFDCIYGCPNLGPNFQFQEELQLLDVLEPRIIWDNSGGSIFSDLFILVMFMWITGMFSEVELLRDVAVLAEHLDRNGLVSQRFIMTRLLEDLLKEKANKDLGYFLAVTSLKSIGNGKLQDESGNMFFPVAFKCRTFMPLRGEVLEGVVHHIYRFGVFLQCGPVKYAFLSFRKMPNYSYVPGENPTFVNDQLAKIENGVVVRFFVLGVRWIEKRGEIMKRDFVMLASLEGESLGPISLSGTDEIDL